MRSPGLSSCLPGRMGSKTLCAVFFLIAGKQYNTWTMIYLDNNATTPVDPEVRAAMTEALERGFGNPSSSHAPGRAARDIVEGARKSVAGLIGADPSEIYFTSGGTESNNLAILGTAMLSTGGHIITSAVEHPSVLNTVKYLEASGFEATYADVDRDCRVRVDEIRKAVRKNTILITIMHSNNETGVLQPVDEIAALARELGIRFHTDAAQSAGKVPVDARACDLITIAAHKLYGPKGIGALYVRAGVRLEPLLHGAGHERGLRPGTENVPGIAGLGRASELAQRDLEKRMREAAGLSRLMLDGLRERFEDTRLNGHPELRLPGTLNVHLPGIDSAAFVESLKDSVAISAGAACHAGQKKPSHVLMAMGLADEDAMASVRISIGKDNTGAEVNEALWMLLDAISRQVRAS